MAQQARGHEAFVEQLTQEHSAALAAARGEVEAQRKRLRELELQQHEDTLRRESRAEGELSAALARIKQLGEDLSRLREQRQQELEQHSMELGKSRQHCEALVDREMKEREEERARARKELEGRMRELEIAQVCTLSVNSVPRAMVGRGLQPSCLCGAAGSGCP
jgi:hypothetical protein